MILYGTRGRTLETERPLIMAILNATPDSFSDGGQLQDDLPGHIQRVLEAGADILDVGGESTRPGHDPVDAEEEIRRVVPVIKAIRGVSAEVWISIDTQKAAVAAAALQAGADFVNDVSALQDSGMARVVRDAGCSIVLMRQADCHGDVVRATRDQLRSLLVRARAAGIHDEQVLLDPGLGFGARPGPVPEDNMALVHGVADYAMGLPVLIGASRKRFIGAMTGIDEPMDRDDASAKIAAQAVAAGASIVRVHDVASTRLALGQ